MAVAKKAPVKKVVKKEAVVKKVAAKAVVAKPAKTTKVEATISAAQKTGTVKITVLDITGKAAGTLSLPEEVFDAKVNPNLMAQAVRVYLANQRMGTASTKTRGEVTGSTRKIYRQKGTGRARHGGIRAPIFVKGGIAHGPKPKDYSLTMPTKMKRASLFSALTTKVKSSDIIVVAGLENVGLKTKDMVKALHAVGAQKALLVMPGHMESIYKAARNIAGISVAAAQQLSTYEVLGAKKIVFMKDAVEKVAKPVTK